MSDYVTPKQNNVYGLWKGLCNSTQTLASMIKEGIDNNKDNNADNVKIFWKKEGDKYYFYLIGDGKGMITTENDNSWRLGHGNSHGKDGFIGLFSNGGKALFSMLTKMEGVSYRISCFKPWNHENLNEEELINVYEKCFSVVKIDCNEWKTKPNLGGYLPQNETFGSRSQLIWDKHAFNKHKTGVVDRYEITEEMFNELGEKFLSLDAKRNIAFEVARTYNRRPDWKEIKINIQGTDIDSIPVPDADNSVKIEKCILELKNPIPLTPEFWLKKKVNKKTGKLLNYTQTQKASMKKKGYYKSSCKSSRFITVTIYPDKSFIENLDSATISYLSKSGLEAASLFDNTNNEYRKEWLLKNIKGVYCKHAAIHVKDVIKYATQIQPIIKKYGLEVIQEGNTGVKKSNQNIMNLLCCLQLEREERSQQLKFEQERKSGDKILYPYKENVTNIISIEYRKFRTNEDGTVDFKSEIPMTDEERKKKNENFNVNKDKDMIVEKNMNKEIVLSINKSIKMNMIALFEKADPLGFQEYKNEKEKKKEEAKKKRKAKKQARLAIEESSEDSGQDSNGDSSGDSSGENDSSPSTESQQQVDSNVITPPVSQPEQASSDNSEGVTETKENEHEEEQQVNIRLTVNEVNNDADDSTEQQGETETSSIEAFDSASYEPDHIPRSATIRRTGLPLEAALAHLNYLENEDFNKEQSVLAIVGDPSNGITGLKTMTKKLLEKILTEDNYNLMLGMSFMTENVYDVSHWVCDLRKLLNKRHNGTEHEVKTGVDIHSLVVALQNWGDNIQENQLEEEA